MNQNLAKKEAGKTVGAVSVLALFIFCIVFASEVLAKGVREGIRLFGEVIFPSVFPFMLFSDWLAASGAFERLSFLSAPFSRFFGIPRSAFGAAVMGLLCGFPIGAKAVAELYRQDSISGEEAERLIPLVSCPSPAFLIGAVGLGLCKSAKIGFFLFLSCLAADGIVAILSRGKYDYNIEKNDVIIRQKYNVVDSVNSAAKTSLSLFGFVTAFSALTAPIKRCVRNEAIAAFLFSFLEIGNASCTLCGLLHSGSSLFPFLLGFSVGFSGLSVFLQISSVVAPFGLSMKRYLPKKLLQGILTGAIFLSFQPFI